MRSRDTLGWCLSKCIGEADLSVTRGTQKSLPNHKAFKTHEGGWSSWNQTLIKKRSVFRQWVTHQGERTVLKSIIIIKTRKRRVSALALILRKHLVTLTSSQPSLPLKRSLGICTKHFSSRSNLILTGFSLSFLLTDNKEGDEHFYIFLRINSQQRTLQREAASGYQRRPLLSLCKQTSLVAKMGHALRCGKQTCSEKLPICMMHYIF